MHMAAGWCIFDSVIDKVGKGFLRPSGITDSSAGDIPLRQDDAACTGFGGVLLHGACDDRCEGILLRMQGEDPRLQARALDKTTDQSIQFLALSSDDRSALRRLRGQRLFGEKLAVEAQIGDRRFCLM